MNPLPYGDVREYVNRNVTRFHERRLESLRSLDIKRVLKKNPYLFRAKNVLTASEIVNEFLDAFLSSSEEELFGKFLEGLAVFVAQRTTGGHKSSASGVDLEFTHNDVHYIVSVKSGPNWGNAAAQDKQEDDLKNAVARVRQNEEANVQAVLGICYGKTRTNFLRGYMKVVGQNFWYFISEDKNLYTDIIEPIGYRAREHNDEYVSRKAEVANLLTKDFIELYCDKAGSIVWGKLVRAACGNYDLDRYLPSYQSA